MFCIWQVWVFLLNSERVKAFAIIVSQKQQIGIFILLSASKITWLWLCSKASGTYEGWHISRPFFYHWECGQNGDIRISESLYFPREIQEANLTTTCQSNMSSTICQHQKSPACLPRRIPKRRTSQSGWRFYSNYLCLLSRTILK